jgi:hypothetical protein
MQVGDLPAATVRRSPTVDRNHRSARVPSVFVPVKWVSPWQKATSPPTSTTRSPMS